MKDLPSYVGKPKRDSDFKNRWEIISILLSFTRIIRNKKNKKRKWLIICTIKTLKKECSISGKSNI